MRSYDSVAVAVVVGSRGRGSPLSKPMLVRGYGSVLWEKGDPR
jgi:hypothetical protein